MVLGCAVAECKNSYKTKKARSDLVFHSFPKEDREKERCGRWIQLCRQKYKFNHSRAVICSDHFSVSAYERDLRNELLGLPSRKILKDDAIPSVFPNRNAGVLTSSNRDERTEKRNSIVERQQILPQIFAEYEEIDKENAKLTAPKDVACQTTFKVYDKDVVLGLRKALWKKRTSNSKKTKQIEHLSTSLKKEKGNVRSLKMQNQAIAKRFSRWTPAQQKLILGIRKRVNWTREDIVKALTVRSVSLRGYENARKNFNLPLPSSRTLRNWTRNFGCEPGILMEVIEIMKSESPSLAAWQRICVLSLDEMSINSTVVLDKADNLLKTASKVQVVMVRGLCDPWKQPIYYEFNQKMTKDILFNIICSVEDAGFLVYMIVNDMSPDNVGLWNQLEVGVEVDKYKKIVVKNKFINPASENRSIYVMADPPHMLKLLRNHILDDGLKLPDGTIINTQTFMKLINKDATQLKKCPKLSKGLLEVKGQKRMVVKHAGRLLSHHAGCLAKCEFPEQPSISDFIITVNDGFDVLNSRVRLYGGNQLKSGYGLFKSQQEKALQNLREVISESRFLTATRKEKGMLPLQKGFIMSTTSIMEVYEDLHSNYEVSYILTSRTNQDCLESLFGRLRGLGGPNTAPTVCEFKYRLRLLLVGSQVPAPKGTNTIDDYDNCSWISAKLLLKNQLRRNTTSNSLARIPQTSEPNSIDAVEYLAGYIAFQLKKTGLIYGKPTSQIPGKSWIHILSRGGLLVPDPNFLKWISKCNAVYEAKKTQATDENAKYAFLNEVQGLHPEISDAIIKTFFDVRTHILVNYLNRQSFSGRKSTSAINKMRHFLRSRARQI